MRKWIPLIPILLGTFMLLIDVTIVNVALPTVARDLHTSFSSLQWVVDAYALALASLLLAIGALADSLGHRRVYVSGLVLFAAASLCCGLAPGSETLIAARVVQGVGGAAMLATTFPLLNATYSGRDRGMAYGLWGAVAGASAAIGPVLGGFLVEWLSWRFVFFVNLPVSIVALGLCFRSVRADAPERSWRVDLPGGATFTLAAAALTLGLIRTGEHGWSSTTWLLIALSAASLVVFIVIELRVAAPLLDLGLFRSKPFVGTMLAALLLNLTAFAILTYSSIWLQSQLRLSPIEAGLTGLPIAGMAFVTSAVLGRKLHGAAPGPIIASGMALIGAGGLVCALLLGDGSRWPALVPGFVLIGVGVGLATPTLSSTAMSAVPARQAGMAAGAVNTARQLGYALGIAALGTIVSAGAAASLRGGAQAADADSTAHNLVGGQAPRLLARAGSGRALLDTALRAAEVHGLVRAFLAVGIAGVVTAVAVFLLVRR
ncbi:MAG: MFS transporter, partial [Gaiellales bacterium]